MPRRNTIREFTEGGIYHIYNRGVEKRDIFLDEQDYAVFLHLLKYYLSPVKPNDDHPLLKFQKYAVFKPKPLTNLYQEIKLLAFCLMPNHFHLLLKQINSDGVVRFMERVSTTYALYFNKRYKRVGYLFQGPYRSVSVDTDNYLLHLSRYIHLNPTELIRAPLINYPYSSYKYYLGQAHAGWVKTDIVLSYFSNSKLQPFLKHYPSYQEFVESCPEDSKEIIGSLSLE